MHGRPKTHKRVARFMFPMIYPMYQVATSLAVPFGAAWLAVHARYRPLLRRFAPAIPNRLAAAPLWVHACSVGEVNTASPLVRAMAERWPDVPVCLTVSTVAGHDLACRTCAEVPCTWLPFDHLVCVRRFVRRLRPRALVAMETELWPNLLRETRRCGAAVMLANGRLSDKHLGRYERFRALLRPVVAQLTVAGMQNQEYAQRLAALGAPHGAVHVTGNTKFDAVATAIGPDVLAGLRAEMGLDAERPCVVFGSTRPGDEALAASCWKELREAFPTAQLVIAPRHIERLGEALAPFDEPLLRRTDVQQGRRPAGERVLVLDTLGELVRFYALASVAVIGGSFYPGVNGHNPLESAALGTPTVFGPYMRNFVDPARELVQAGGAVQVAEPEGLADTLHRLLAESHERAGLSARAREAVRRNQGATERTLDLLETAVPDLG